MEICKPKLTTIGSIPTGSPINIIGFAGQAPVSFDLIKEPHYFSYSPLMRINSIDSKTPDNLLNGQIFMNCTGDLRLIDHRRLYMDTPSTYGFSGGPCFFTLNKDPYEFNGVLTGTTRLWNTCILLTKSSIFQWYYNRLISNSNENNLLKIDL